MKEFQKKWALDADAWKLPGSKKRLISGEILASDELQQKNADSTFYKECWFNENNFVQRYIVSFSLKYKKFFESVKNQQLARAAKIVQTGSSVYTSNRSKSLHR